MKDNYEILQIIVSMSYGNLYEDRTMTEFFVNLPSSWCDTPAFSASFAAENCNGVRAVHEQRDLLFRVFEDLRINLRHTIPVTLTYKLICDVWQNQILVLLFFCSFDMHVYCEISIVYTKIKDMNFNWYWLYLFTKFTVFVHKI